MRYFYSIVESSKKGVAIGTSFIILFRLKVKDCVQSLFPYLMVVELMASMLVSSTTLFMRVFWTSLTVTPLKLPTPSGGVPSSKEWRAVNSRRVLTLSETALGRRPGLVTELHSILLTFHNQGSV